MRSVRVFAWTLLLAIILFSNLSYAQSDGGSQKPGLMGGGGGGGASAGGASGGGTALPDLFTGTMSHSIPIEVPPGRKGMDPGLELTYRSGGGDSWVGLGWDLEAGAIERGTKWGVCYTCDDYLFRMGSTIDLVNIAPSEYRAKVEGAFSRIRKITGTDGRPAWQVTDRSGTNYFFGRSSVSRQDNPANLDEIFKWLLERVEDTDGNYMTFTYAKELNQIYLDRVDYAGNVAGITPNIYVKFYRASIFDVPVPAMYTTVFEVRTARRLKTIDVVANGARVRTYKLSYRPGGSQSTLRSLLDSVQQFGKDATLDASGTITNEGTASKLPASTFTYASDGSFSIFTDGSEWRSGWCNGGGAQFGTGDFNGDANLDIWCHDRALGNSVIEQNWTPSDTPLYGGSGYTWAGDFNGDGLSDIASANGGNIYVKRSTGSGFIEEGWWTSSTPHWGSTAAVWPGDFNGDGLTDIATYNDGKMWLKRSTGSSFVEEPWGDDTDNWGGDSYRWVGDFNGDGRQDIATADGGTIWVKRSIGLAFVEEEWTTSAPNWGGGAYTRVGDFNGDGLQDIATAEGGTIWVKRSTGSSFVQETWTTSAPNWGGSSFTWVGDFNGDGLQDIATAEGGTIWVKRSTGSSFVQETWTTSATWNGSNRAWAADFNRDGLTDILSNAGGEMRIKRSTGSSFVEEFFGDDYNWGDDSYNRLGDFNGDGLPDIFIRESGGVILVKLTVTGSGGGDVRVALSNGNGAFTDITVNPWRSNWCRAAGAMFGTGDFNADGKTDIFCHDRPSATSITRNTMVALSDGDGAFYDVTVNPWRTNWCSAGAMFGTGDFNADGMTDIFCKSPQNNTPGTTSIALSNGAGAFTDGSEWLSNWCGEANRTFGTGDFNGDGRADLYCTTIPKGGTGVFIALANISTNGVGSFIPQNQLDMTLCWGPGARFGTGDFNGDGKTDIFCHQTAVSQPLLVFLSFVRRTYVSLSTGNGQFTAAANWKTNWCLEVGNTIGTGDFNGDGKTDLYCHSPQNNTPGKTLVSLSRGTAFDSGNDWRPGWCGHGGAVFGAGDFNGDGRTDVFCHDTLASSAGKTWIARAGSTGILTDLLVSISNGIGGTSTIGYTPSSRFLTKQLPFPVHVVSSVTTNSGIISATTNYSYTEGYYYFLERDFRGFHRVTVTGPLGPNGERSVTETAFHQGSDIGFGQNEPNVTVGYMKGKPYQVLVKNGAGQLFSEVQTNYLSDNTEPYFNPPTQVDTILCDGDGVCGSRTRSLFNYDSYGNLTREEHQGEIVGGNNTSDDRIVTRDFSPNTGEPWIIGLPYRERVSTFAGSVKSSTDFYYDGVSSGTAGCQQASANTLPQKGNLTRIVRWLDGGSSPETRMSYDSYGNLVCTRNANGHTTTISHDGSFTFPKVTTNPLGHQTTTQYYGIDGVATDTGLYGQVKSVTDNANNVTTTTTYDPLGRRAGLIPPSPDAPTSWSYNSFGTLGQQNVQSTTAGLSTWTYFDGFGRTTLEKRTGPDGKNIATQTIYNNTGTVKQISLPYFDGTGTPIWKTFIYDPMGRMTQATNPDGSRVLQCYNEGVAVAIDASNHRKREVRDAFGRLVQVNEYQSTFTICTTDVGTPYATTTYQYDLLGSLVKVTDAKGNQTTMRYDTLGRKIAMSDPDMGRCGDLVTLTPSASYPWYATPCWNYRYDAIGNLLQQSDAKGQTLHFQYDAVNRLLQKDYTTLKTLGSGDVVYRYDNTTVGTYRMGRLWQVTDSSGIATFTYDKLGRQTQTDKTIISSDPVWTTQTVDSGGNTGQHTSIAVDASGNQHISYYDATNQDLKYAKWTGSSWSIQTVESAGNVGLITSIALDSAGNPHISYAGGGLLKYAKWTGGSWSIQTVDPSIISSSYSTSLALDSAGQPHIAYMKPNAVGNPRLYYAKWTGSSWSIQEPNTTVSSVTGASLALDSSANPHIAYADSGVIKYTKWTGSAWTTQNVDTTGSTANPSLGLDGAGIPHIGYGRVTVLKYAKWNGSAWALQTVASDWGNSKTSTVLDGSGNPHIGYYATNGDLKYAKWTGTVWAIQAADISGDVGQYPSLRFDPTGNPQISYYDATNQDLKFAKFAPGTAVYTTQTGYDPLGRVSSVSYPDGSSVQYAYNGPLLDRAFEGTTNYAQYTGYNALGQPTRLTLGNGVTTDYQYKPNNFRIHSIFTTHAATSQCFQSLLYNYDSVANVTDIIDYRNPTTGVCGSVSETNTQNFGYDGLNRLTAATGPYGAFSYAYNEIGNMTSNSQVGSYTYPTSGPTSVRPHAVAQAGANTYGYDANGNMTAGAGRTITYDIENRPIQVISGGVTTTFIYDGDGGRVKKTAGGITTVYIGKLYECTGSTCSKYIFAGSQRVALKPVGSSEVYYYQPDHLGSSNVVTNQAGTKLQELTYYPYGQTRTNTGSINVNHKYTSQELDSSTGLYFYNARYYDPVLGRFISPDTIVPGRRNPQNLNRYSYVSNNPINYTDPSGHWKLRNFLKSVGNVAAWVAAPNLMAQRTIFLALPQTYQTRVIQISSVAGSIACPACAPAIAAASAMVLADMNGGTTRDMIKAGAIGAGVGYVAGTAGSYVSTSGGASGAIAGGAASGYISGAGTTLAYGGSWQQAYRAGYQGAAIGAASAAIMYYAESALTVANTQPTPDTIQGKCHLDYNCGLRLGSKPPTATFSEYDEGTGLSFFEINLNGASPETGAAFFSESGYSCVGIVCNPGIGAQQGTAFSFVRGPNTFTVGISTTYGSGGNLELAAPWVPNQSGGWTIEFPLP
ncbi:FG-GAP-like repeat-containing protein [Candidatus Manganitrophus noduliformans]|uniref:DM13 domain-containing protein n=1 Tax=Candidatus Manganitrophus noduliformans TaxID=2606439 RepID=A0A7X6DQM9_9BACT|nr:FG-GAP-like repeat-containing protein [Candidatus Manganitrophus noduliformans]NKE71607.1 hypothetical protein [Candidatus Manganitrophus noduliformans]